MTTKAQLIGIITNFLREHPEKELYVPRQGNALRNGRFGYVAYALCYRDNEVFCRPWAGANIYWRTRFDKLKKADLQDIVGRCFIANK